MTAAAAWRGVFIERLKATGNITLAASGRGRLAVSCLGSNAAPLHRSAHSSRLSKKRTQAVGHGGRRVTSE